MEEFIKSASSLYWWLSVVIVGIAINVFSAYIKQKLDRYLSSTSNWWRERSEAQLARRQEQICALREDSNLRLLMCMRVIIDFFFVTISLIAVVLGMTGLGIATVLFELRMGGAVNLTLKQTVIKIILSFLGVLVFFLGVKGARNSFYKFCLLI
jgi:hypothetical protein